MLWHISHKQLVAEFSNVHREHCQGCSSTGHSSAECAVVVVVIAAAVDDDDDDGDDEADADDDDAVVAVVIVIVVGVRDDFEFEL